MEHLFPVPIVDGSQCTLVAQQLSALSDSEGRLGVG